MNNKLSKKPANRLTDNGFSMVEIMITVVIIGVCLVMALRVFSFCARAVSDAYYSTCAVNVLEEKIDALREQSVLMGGVEAVSTMEDIEKYGRHFTFTQEIVDWEAPLVELEEEESKTKEEESEGEAGAMGTNLCEAFFEVEWGPVGRRKNIKVKTMLPAKTAFIVGD